jgi:energy-coupling factor transport system ATP-binding protein
MERRFIAGTNFSGRSEALRKQIERQHGATFFAGPYAEAALSGLASMVVDEIAIYAAEDADKRAAFAPIDWAQFATRKPATLSGGEQVLLALHCFSRSAYRTIAIDTALEQLDARNRASALRYLSSGEDSFDVRLIDNRMDQVPAGWIRDELAGTSTELTGDLGGVIADLPPREAPVIAVRGLDFAYRAGATIFRSVDLTLEPGQAYRLSGPNGAGKTTLFRLLVGVLKPSGGAVLRDGKPYAPHREGNRAFALAMQNPDHQWCGATLAEDIVRRRRALAGVAEAMPPSDDLLGHLARRLGVASPDQHLYELPLALRKRLGWLWPLSGAMPWIMLDEPTIGQDHATRAALAAIVARLCAIGYGVVVVTHDDDFAACFPHRQLGIEEGAIKLD